MTHTGRHTWPYQWALYPRSQSARCTATTKTNFTHNRPCSTGPRSPCSGTASVAKRKVLYLATVGGPSDWSGVTQSAPSSAGSGTRGLSACLRLLSTDKGVPYILSSVRGTKSKSAENLPHNHCAPQERPCTDNYLLSIMARKQGFHRLWRFTVGGRRIRGHDASEQVQRQSGPTGVESCVDSEITHKRAPLILPKGAIEPAWGVGQNKDLHGAAPPRVLQCAR